MKKLKFLLLCFLLSIFSIAEAQRTITGQITNKEDGTTMPGVTIALKGTTLGTISDVNGRYTINVPEDVTTLVFTYVGMVKQEIVIGTSNVINVIMEPDVLNLEGVVVTAIGITREAKTLGYSVQEVGGEALTRTQNANVVNAIGGKVAGVQVTQTSGTAGGGSYITIRGQASIDQENQPLFIIDGIPIDNSHFYSGNPDDEFNNLNEGVDFSNRAIDLNPNDIESISVLKGGAATALYGIRAANGAIIITTKKGKATVGKVINVTLNSSISFDEVNKLPPLQKRWGQGYGGDYYDPGTGASTVWGPLLDTMYFDGDPNYTWDRNGMLVGQSDPTAKTKFEPYDNADNFFRTGITVNNNLALAGGSKDAVYYFSIGDMKQTGVIPNNDYRKTSIRISGESQFWKRLKTSASINYIKSGGQRIQQGSNVSGLMLGLLRTPASFDNANGYDDPLNTPEAYMLPGGFQRNYRGGAGYDNPWWSVNQNIFEDDVNRMIGNFTVIYTPLEWMTVTYRIGSDFYNDRRKNHLAINSRENPTGQVFNDNHTLQDINSDLLVTADRNLTEDFRTILTVGNNMFSHYYQQQYVQGDGLTIPDFYHVSNASSVLSRELIERKRTAAFYGDLGLSWKSMIFLNVTGRNEWSTTLPADNNSFFYPSVSGGFVITELPGLKDNNILPFAKLRASYAQIANDADPYATITYYEQPSFGDGWTDGIVFPFVDDVPGWYVGYLLGNPELGPENLKSFEVGIDLRFIKNRAGIDFAYYNNQNEDLILEVPVAGTSGYRAITQNVATMENKGVEIVLRGTPIKTKNFSWDILVNFTQNKNKVLSLAEGIEAYTIGGFTGSLIRVVAGEPYGSMYGNRWLRDSEGNILVQDDTSAANYGFPMMDEAEGTIGNILPDWIAGIFNEFRYKNISLSFLFDIRHGGDMWNGTKGALYYIGTHEDTESRDPNDPDHTKVWEGRYGHLDANGNIVHYENGVEVSGTGGENTTSVEMGQNWYVDGEGSGFTGPVEYFMEDAGWVRLKEVNLSYSINTEKLKINWLKQFDVYFSGRNLLLWTDYSGVDPETSLYGANNAQGMDYFNMPNTRTYTFGVKLGF